MEQLNRVYDHLQEEQGNLTRVAQTLSTEWDPVARMAELASETLELRQCNEIVVEAALRLDLDVGGQQPVTAQSWSALLAAADAYRTMTTLSERLHHRVAPAIIEISSAYELTFKDDEHVTDDSWVLEGDLSTRRQPLSVSARYSMTTRQADLRTPSTRRCWNPSARPLPISS